MIDFGILNTRRTRLTVGAVNVRSGNFIYFDNARESLDVRHIIASGALPPALPAHLIYQQKSYEGHAKDCEFSGTSMREHWTAGYHDTRRTLRHPEWLAPSVSSDALVVHDLHRDDDA